MELDLWNVTFILDPSMSLSVIANELQMKCYFDKCRPVWWVVLLCVEARLKTILVHIQGWQYCFGEV